MNQMRSSQKNRNGRHKSRGNKPSGNILNRVYESAGPEGKVRGTAQQIIEKYLVLARDAQTSGDRVVAENFLQHAEHYIRLVNAAMPPQTEDRRFQGYGGGRDDAEGGSDESDDQPDYQPVRNGHGGGQHDDPRESTGHRTAEATRRPEASDGGALETIDTGDDGHAGPVPTPEASMTAPTAREPEAKRAETSGEPEKAADAPAEAADPKATAAQTAEARATEAQAEAGTAEGEAKPKPRRRTRRPKVTDEAPAS